jgi:hypothetical protein
MEGSDFGAELTPMALDQPDRLYGFINLFNNTLEMNPP